MKSCFMLAGMLLVMVNACADEVYRWVDESGKVFYGDIPAVGIVQFEKKKFAESPAINEELPYETLHASSNFPVVLYVSDNCETICKDARQLLSKRGIPFSEKILTTRQEIDDFKTMSGGGIVPTISVGESWIRGFQADMWNKELDIAGYPKTSPYHSPSAPDKQPAKEPETGKPAVEESTVETPNVETPAAEAPAVEQ